MRLYDLPEIESDRVLFELFVQTVIPIVFDRSKSEVLYNDGKENDEHRIPFQNCMMKYYMYSSKFDLTLPNEHVKTHERRVRPFSSTQDDMVLIGYDEFRDDIITRQTVVK